MKPKQPHDLAQERAASLDLRARLLDLAKRLGLPASSAALERALYFRDVDPTKLH